MKAKIIFIILSLLSALSGTAGADQYLLVDQSHITDVDSWHNLSYYKFDQEFLPSFFSMDAVDVAIYTNEGATLRVNIREGSLDGPLEGVSEEVYLPPAFAAMARFIFASRISLAAGVSYVIDLELTGGSAYVASGFQGGGYPGGYMFIDGISSSSDKSDIIFRTGLSQSDLIQIKKGGSAFCGNRNASDGLLIAILSSDMFDATTVNPATVSFGGAGVKKTGKSGRYLCSKGDANRDGLPDLMCRVDPNQLSIEEGASSVTVEAATFDGTTMIGDEDPQCAKEREMTVGSHFAGAHGRE
jgi:hypothetical protein